MNRVVQPLDIPSLENGFVKESASFLVSDDLYIMPNVFGASADLFHKLGIEDMNTLEEQIVVVTKKEVCHLLTLFLYIHSFISLVPSLFIAGSGLAQVFIDLKDSYDRFNLKK